MTTHHVKTEPLFSNWDLKPYLIITSTVTAIVGIAYFYLKDEPISVCHDECNNAENLYQQLVHDETENISYNHCLLTNFAQQCIKSVCNPNSSYQNITAWYEALQSHCNAYDSTFNLPEQFSNWSF